MSKQINQTGYRVIVEPRVAGMPWYRAILGDEKAKASRLKDLSERADEIAAQIKRHVDGIDSVEVEAETEAVCSHCGYGWTETSMVYNGGCCDEDEAGNPEAAIARAGKEPQP